MNNLERYEEIFIDVFGVSSETLNADFSFKGNGLWDSIAHMQLITTLEDTFDVMFETTDILNFGSYNNGITILKKYGVGF